MMEAHILLLLGIKERGRWIGLDHVEEKVSRDIEKAEGKKPGHEALLNSLEGLKRMGLIEEEKARYRITEAGRRRLYELVESGGKLNLSYLLVWKAQHYYEKKAKHILPFLKGRPVSMIKVFTDDTSPFSKVKSIFVRYARYRPRPTFFKIEDKERLIELVYDHGIDFIPYVHKEGAKEPDIFLIDLDPGDELKTEEGFELAKRVAYHTYELLKEHGIEPLVKFSGSRGFQFLCSLDNDKLKGREDLFLLYRRIIQAFQLRLEERLKEYEDELLSSPPYTTSQVKDRKARAKRILVDWSSMKPMGDYRAPFSIHYRTGLVSLPLEPSGILSFKKEDAEPLKLASKDILIPKPMKPQDPEDLLSLLADRTFEGPLKDV